MQPNNEQKPQTYLGQVFDRPANLLILALVAVFGVWGYFLPGEGRWLLWVGCLVILAVFFGVPFFSKEKRAQRGK